MVEKNSLPEGQPVVARVKPKPEAAPAEPKVRPEPRKKVTPEEVEERFARARAKREERKENRPPRETAKLVRVAVASALGLGICAFGFGINGVNTEYSVEAKANQNQSAALKGAMAALEPVNGEDLTKQLETGLGAAQKRSEELAAAQQKFAGIAHAGNSEPTTNDGRPNPAVLKSLEHRKVLAGFFAPAALILKDSEAYTFRTEDLLKPGKIDPRQPWFTRYEASAKDGEIQKAALPDSYTWKTATVTLSGTPDVLSVIWTNTDAKSGDLLAWATARYTVQNNTFSHLTVNTTTQGDSQQLKVTTTQPATAKGAKT